MEEQKTIICRLCLEVISQNCQNLTPPDSHVFQRLSFVLSNQAAPCNLNHPICSKCSEGLQRCYDFKAKCLEIEENLREYKKIHNASVVKLQEAVFKGRTGFEINQAICRLCCIQGIDRFSKFDVYNDESLGQMVLLCLPEMDISSTSDPVICHSCFQNLRHQYSFTRRCLRVEEKISDYLDQLKTGIEEVNAVKMLQFLVQNANNKRNPETETGSSDDTVLEDLQQIGPGIMETLTVASPASFVPTERVFSCKKCSFTSLTDNELKYHFVETHGVNGRTGLYKCDSCPFITRHYNVWNNHRLIHLSEDEVVWLYCKKCTYRSKLKGNLEKHMLTHSAPEDKRFKCEECPYQSMWKRDLERHRVKHLGPGQVTMYGCTLCPFSTKHQRYLKFHVQKVHYGIDNKASDETYYCAQCTFSTKQKRSLVPHMITHRNFDEVPTFRCRFCAYEAKAKRSVKLHEATHLKTYKCDECEFVTSQQRLLAEHARGHLPVAEPVLYACAECAFTTVYKPSFVKHALVHKRPDEVEMHRCHHCAYASKRRQDLRQHVRALHTENAKVYECDVCGYKTKYKGGLGTHKKLQHQHPDDVPKFRCSSCPFETKYKSSLLSHEEALHKHFDEASLLKCDLCAFKTKRRECLRKHADIHRTDCEMFECDRCGFATKYKRALRKHMETHDKSRRRREEVGRRDERMETSFEEVKVEPAGVFLKEEAAA